MCKTKRVLNAYQTTKEGFLQKCSSNLETSTKRSGLLKPTPLILKPTPLIEFLNSISALFLLSLWKDILCNCTQIEIAARYKYLFLLSRYIHY